MSNHVITGGRQRYFCIACEELQDGKSAEVVACTNCGHTIESSIYTALVSHAERAALYGYAYRVQFEEDKAGANSPIGYARQTHHFEVSPLRTECV